MENVFVTLRLQFLSMEIASPVRLAVLTQPVLLILKVVANAAMVMYGPLKNGLHLRCNSQRLHHPNQNLLQMSVRGRRILRRDCNQRRL